MTAPTPLPGQPMRNLHHAWDTLGAEETPQQRFDRLYVTSSELCKELHVTRPSIMHARRKGLLPEPILAGPAYVWERAHVQPYVDAWKLILTTRRTHAAAQPSA